MLKLLHSAGLQNLAVLAACIAIAATSEGSEPKSFELTIAEGAVSGESDTIRVKEGDRVELHWLSDETLALHLHGYDLDLELASGEEVSLSFEATIPGRFPISSHSQSSSEDPHRPLLHIEVHPQ